MSGKKTFALIAAVIAITAGTGVVLFANAQEAPRDAAGQPVAAASSSSAVAKPRVVKTPFRGDKVDGKPVLLRKPLPTAPVQWKAALDQTARAKSLRKTDSVAARLPQLELDKTRLPVILPRAGVIDASKAKMVSFGDAYALNLPQAKGVQITMYGNRSFVPAEAGAVSKKAVSRLANVAEDIRISQMEDGWTATFTRYGVVYSLDVSCDDINSPVCQSDTYIREAIAQFDDVALGSEAQAEAEEAAKPTNWLDGVAKTVRDLTGGK